MEFMVCPKGMMTMTTDNNKSLIRFINLFDP